jgi:hypothetical protein
MKYIFSTITKYVLILATLFNFIVLELIYLACQFTCKPWLNSILIISIIVTIILLITWIKLK